MLNGLADKIDAILQQRRFCHGAFVRLGSRSPKDSITAHKEGMRCQDGRKAIRLLLGSERVAEDLALASAYNYTPSIAVREWVNIAPWQEFRAFFKGRRLAGISQYFYRHGYPELQDETMLDNIRQSIEEAGEELTPFFPAEDMVADFIYCFHDYGSKRIHQVRLLEINPYGPLTDPCLFDWSKDDFCALEFRIVRGDSASRVVSLARR